MAKVVIWSVVVVVLMAFAASVSAAMTYEVGGSTGWNIPSDSKTYNNWGAGQTFRIEDRRPSASPPPACTTTFVDSPNTALPDGSRGRRTHLRPSSFHRRRTQLDVVVYSSWAWSGGALFDRIGCRGPSLVLEDHM
ncbi:hypothetical protein QJS10_CPB12g00611 [Acorus calamus]|uniref:Phytocyanin domain-containing protein n=1 Tax=Acorus calamus TaxID=4465 RepID=A0AAV9DPH6_ACOCL|nr:hypothetical protein QJS10_CPB12g00611 [Acorus calamus]